MKKIILILFLTSIFAEYNNPNGKPFTLNVKIYQGRIEGPKNDNSYQVEAGSGGLSLKLPISSKVTILGGFYQDGYVKFTPANWSDNIYQSEGTYVNNVYYGGIELHLPLYKIWEN